MRKLHTMLAALLLPCLVLAQQQPTAWTLQACLQRAKDQNLALQQARLTVQQRQNDNRQNLGNALPGVSLDGSQSYSAGGRSINPFDNQVVENESFRSNNFTLGAQVNLFNGFQNTNRIRQGKEQLEAAKLNYEKQENDILLQVTDRFISILNAEAQLENAQLQAASTRQQLARTTRLVQAGSAPLANQYAQEAQLGSEELAIVNAENALALAKLGLQQLLLLPVSATFAIAAPAALPAMATDQVPSAAEVYATAVANMPEIKAAERNMRVAEYGLAISRGGYMPSLSMSGGFFTNYSSLATRSTVVGFTSPQEVEFGYFFDAQGARVPVFTTVGPQPIRQSEKFEFGNQLDNNLRRSLTLNLSIPLFSRFSNQVNVANSKLNLENTSLAKQQEMQTLRQNIEQATQNLQAAAARYAASTRQVRNAEESLRATQQRYDAGAANNADFIQAKNLLNTAKATLINAQYELLFRQKVIDFYQGKGLDL